MKKTMAIIWLIIAFFIIYFLQSNFFNWFNIAGVKPNIFIIFVLFIGLFAGGKVGAILGLIFGIILDFLIGRTVGISGILLGIVGALGEKFDKNFSKESRITNMLMVTGCTIIYEIIVYIYRIVGFNVNPEIISFLNILLIEIIYNMIIVIIIYPIIQKAGYALENTFKVKNILTKYF